MENIMTTLVIGQNVPDFSLESSDGAVFSLVAQRGAPLVLFFYPRDNTPGCTRENQDFRDLHEAFSALGVRIYGISRDSLKSHLRFCEKQSLNFPLLSDESEHVCSLFDVMREKNMYGKKVRGIERSTFLIDAEGRLIESWRKVNVDGHAAIVLETCRKMLST